MYSHNYQQSYHTETQQKQYQKQFGHSATSGQLINQSRIRTSSGGDVNPHNQYASHSSSNYNQTKQITRASSGGVGSIIQQSYTQAEGKGICQPKHQLVRNSVMGVGGQPHKIKITKISNPKQIVMNGKHHIKSRDRSHSGSSSCPRGVQQYNDCSRSNGGRSQNESYISEEPKKSSYQQQKQNPQLYHKFENQSQIKNKALSNILVEKKKTNFIQPRVSTNVNDGQCEPFEAAIKSPEMPQHMRRKEDVPNSPYFQQKQMPHVINKQKSDQIGGFKNNSQENIINGAFCNDTSTFGKNRNEHPRTNEETMGISTHVQQMIASRGRIDSGTNNEIIKQDNNPENIESKENIFKGNIIKQAPPQKSTQQRTIQKISINSIKQISQPQNKNTVTSRNSLQIKRPSIVGPSKSLNLNLKPQKSQILLSATNEKISNTRNLYQCPSQAIGVANQSIKKLKIKTATATPIEPGQGQKLRQPQISQRKSHHQNIPASQQGSSSSSRVIRGPSAPSLNGTVKQSYKNVQRKEKDAVHIHYHNINYIKVINKPNSPVKDIGLKPNQPVKTNGAIVRDTSSNSAISAISTISVGDKSAKNNKIKKDSIIASRRCSNSKPLMKPSSTKHAKSPINFKLNLEVKNQAQRNNGVQNIHNGVDQSFIMKLQDSLLKQQNQQSLVADSLEGTEREAYRKQHHRPQSPLPSPAVQVKQQIKVSHSKRAELVTQLTKYIKFNGDNKKSEDELANDFVQDNLRKFLQFLENNQVININEVRRDPAQMTNLINDIISEIDVSQLQNPNFMVDQKAKVIRVANSLERNTKRSASGQSHASNKQQLSYASNNDCYNTSGAINLNGQIQNNYKNHQQYFSQNSNRGTTATSGGGTHHKGNHVNRNENHQRLNTPDSYLQTSQNSTNQPYITEHSQQSNKYNTSGDQSKMIQRGDSNRLSMGQPNYVHHDTSINQRSANSRQIQQPSLPTQLSQLSSQGTHTAINNSQQQQYQNFFQSSGNSNENAKIREKIRQDAGVQQQQQQQVHNTTINLQINANVDNLNINGVGDKQEGHINQPRQGQLQYKTGSMVGQNKYLNRQQVPTAQQDGFGIVQKQKRGGSHEEQTRTKQILQNEPNPTHTSRIGTAAANQKAFGIKQTNQIVPNKRVNSATTITKRSRSIHQKVEHLNGSQKQQLQEEIIKDREKIIKWNKSYIKKYNKFPPTTIEFYRFVKVIGNGSFGQVILAIHKLTGKQVAIKVIEQAQLKDNHSKKKAFQECYILKKIRHSNIIRLFEVFENKKHFMMVMEYVGGGDLYQKVKKIGYLKEEDSKYIFKQIAQGVAHCHCRSVLHRDIKLANILLDGEGGVKLCDFGVSRLITENEVIQEQCGTPAYLAPEMSGNAPYSNFYVDIWSLGILLYAMLQNGNVPFKAEKMDLPSLHEEQIKMKIRFPMQISQEGQHLIKRMLVIKPEDRISLPELLSHPWLKNIIGPDGLPLENETDDDDDIHDFQMGLDFQRQECNLNPLSVGAGDITERCINAAGGHKNKELVKIGNINQVNIKNLFFNRQSEACKLSYMNYCSVTQDFTTYRIDEDALSVLESFGYPRQLVIKSINEGDLNHATCCYELLVQL